MIIIFLLKKLKKYTYKNSKLYMNTYLGQKGYSILKNELSVEEQIKIKKN